MPQKHRTPWTNAEIEVVVGAMADNLKENPGASLPETYRRIKGCLPAARQNDWMSAKAHFDKYVPLIRDAMKGEKEPVDAAKTSPFLCEASTDELWDELLRRKMKDFMPELTKVVVKEILAKLA